MILDSDGSVTDALLGAGASLSATALGQVRLSIVTGKIVQGLIVLNGRVTDGLFDPDDLTEADLTRAAVNAIGQMLNLGTSDLNDELVFDGDVANNRSTVRPRRSAAPRSSMPREWVLVTPASGVPMS